MNQGEHEQIEDLLPRYATLLREGKDASAIYPLVTQHLNGCYECQELLKSLLDTPWPNDSLKLDPNDLPFFRQGLPSALSGDEPPADVPPTQDTSVTEVMRGFNAIQSGGRLLMQKTLTIDEQDVTVILTLHREADADIYTITGEIYADVHAPDIQASLDINGEQYIARARDSELLFKNVKVDQADMHFDLSLKLLH